MIENQRISLEPMQMNIPDKRSVWEKNSSEENLSKIFSATRMFSASFGFLVSLFIDIDFESWIARYLFYLGAFFIGFLLGCIIENVFKEQKSKDTIYSNEQKNHKNRYTAME